MSEYRHVPLRRLADGRVVDGWHKGPFTGVEWGGNSGCPALTAYLGCSEPEPDGPMEGHKWMDIFQVKIDVGMLDECGNPTALGIAAIDAVERSRLKQYGMFEYADRRSAE